MVHLMRIAAWEERWDAVGELVRHMEPTDQDLHLRPYRALAAHDTAALIQAIEALRPIDATSVFMSAVRFALYTHRLDVAERTFGLLTDPRRPPNERAAGHHALGFLAAAQGRWREARARLDSARALKPHYGLEAWSRLALVPYAPIPLGELAALRDTVMRSRGIAVDSTTRPALYEFKPAEYPLRLTGNAALIDVRLNDTADIVRVLPALAEGGMPAPTQIQRWRGEREALLRAELLRLAGQSQAAVAAAPVLGLPDEYGMRDQDRFLLGELLGGAGRLAEALQLFGSFEQAGVQSLPWAAPGHFARGELLERLGRNREAAAEYARVVELWRACDPELRPLRDEARRRAERLTPQK
jgi:tetratricopeptide (TPR) repeat protein